MTTAAPARVLKQVELDADIGERVKQVAEAEGISQAALMREAIARYVRDDKFDYLSLALGLCPDCKAMFRHFATAGDRDATRMIRDMIWKWVGMWAHGNACPSTRTGGEP